MSEIKETNFRKKNRLAGDRATQNLLEKGWRYDGLWYYSPYSKIRYNKREAVYVEELRDWSSGPSAFLNDYEHAVWVAQEEEANEVIEWDELARRSKQRKELSEESTRSNINCKV